MADTNKIDDFFEAEAIERKHKNADARSRMLLMVKLALPIVAAFLGAALLIWPAIKKDLSELAIDFVIPSGDIEKMDIEKTVFYLTDAKGRVNNFNAQQVKETSGGSKIYNLSGPEAFLPVGNEEWINLRSPEGIYDQNKSVLNLPRKVELYYSRGFNLETRDLVYDFGKSAGYSRAPVVGYGFLGHLNAEAMEIRDNGNVLVFSGKTTIIIDEKSFHKEDE